MGKTNKPEGKKDKWIIEAEYGSSFQEECINGAFDACVQSMVNFYNRQHKKNKLRWRKETNIL